MAFVKYFSFIVAFLLLLSACATTQRTDLYFGRDIPGGGQVSNEQWKLFSDSTVSPRFPEGYTERDANGKWLDTDIRQTITEPTKVLTFVGKKSKARQAGLDTVIQVYIQQYHQQAVLRVDSKVRVKFVERRLTKD
jgi:hypothetical protein